MLVIPHGNLMSAICISATSNLHFHFLEQPRTTLANRCVSRAYDAEKLTPKHANKLSFGRTNISLPSPTQFNGANETTDGSGRLIRLNGRNATPVSDDDVCRRTRKGKISEVLCSFIRKRAFLPLLAASVVLGCPPIILIDDSIHLLGNMANAQPMGQVRQAAMFLERLAGQTTSGKILDKVMTVISGQTLDLGDGPDIPMADMHRRQRQRTRTFSLPQGVTRMRHRRPTTHHHRTRQTFQTPSITIRDYFPPVTPDMVEELKSIIEGEDGARDWKADLTSNIGNYFSTIIDVISKFNPSSLTESAGAGIQGLLEAAAERFAAFEFSTLLALGERWLLWAPILIPLMYWRMSRSKNSEENYREGRQDVVEFTEQAIARAQRVRRELERIGLKADLLDAVYSIAKSSKGGEELKRRQIQELMLKLQQLNPMDIAYSKEDWSNLSGTGQRDSLSQFEPVAHVDGEWRLIYVSQADPQIEQQQFPEFPSLNFPGVDLSNIQQNIWQKEASQDDGFHQMLTNNTAEIRLGFLGVLKVSVQGTWQNLKDGQSALVFFDTFSLRPMELLGVQIREDLPPLNLPIPSALQIPGEWEVVYLDKSLRMNQGRRRQLFLFQKL